MKLSSANVRNVALAVAGACVLLAVTESYLYANAKAGYRAFSTTAAPAPDTAAADVAALDTAPTAGAMARQVRYGMSLAQVEYLANGTGEARGVWFRDGYTIIFHTGAEFTQVTFQAINGEMEVVGVIHFIAGKGYI